MEAGSHIMLNRKFDIQAGVQFIILLGTVIAGLYAFMSQRDSRLAVLESKQGQQTEEVKAIKDDFAKRLERIENKLDQAIERRGH